MSVATTSARRAHRVLYGLLALALASGWLVAAALPAGAAQDWGVESPAPGAVVTAAFPIGAFAVTFADQGVEQMRWQLRRGGATVVDGTLSAAGESAGTLPGQTRSTWNGVARFGDRLPNGVYAVEVSAVNSAYPNGSPWRGHEIVIDVPPTATLEIARVADANARKVELRWARSSAPDHVRYVVQRAQGGGSFTDVHTVNTSDSSVYVDTVPEYGDYRYRIKVVRMAADGSEREAVSEPRSVSVQPDASGRPETGEEPDGIGGGDAEPPADEGGGGGDGDGAAPGPGTSVPQLSPPAPTTTPAPTSSRAQRPNVNPPPNPNSTFEERLDYGELPEWDTEEEPPPEVLAEAGEDPGTLTVFGGDGGVTTEQALKPVAGGLVLTMFGLHIVRFLRSET